MLLLFVNSGYSVRENERYIFYVNEKQTQKNVYRRGATLVAHKEKAC